MELIERLEEAEENAKRFVEVKNNVHSIAYERLGRFYHWYCFPNIDVFAPSKFIGYKNTTLASYTGKGITGTKTQKVLSRWFYELHQDSTLYEPFRRKLDSFLMSCERTLSKRAVSGTRGIYVPKGIINEETLAKAVESTRNNRVNVSASQKLPVLEPIICKTQEELDKKASELFSSIQGKKVIGQEKPEKHEISTIIFARDAAVVAYVLVLSQGFCECCSNKAPFLKENDQPFLEVHHVKHLANGGKDTISNAVAVCPNCHRELHYGINKNALVQLLYSKIVRLICND